MSKEDPVFIYLGVYDDPSDADDDYENLKDLHRAGVVGTYDAAIVMVTDDMLRIEKHEKPTQHGAWTGLAVGAVIGLLFPPALVGGTIGGAVGAAVGGLIGHLWKGLSRSDLKDLGTALDEGEVAFLVIGVHRFDDFLDDVYGGAYRVVKKELAADFDTIQKEIENAYDEATKT